MSINPGTQNTENLGNSAETLRLIFRALDLKFFAHDSIGKTSLFEPRQRFNQSHLPEHHANSSIFSAIPPAPTQTHNSAASLRLAIPCPRLSLLRSLHRSAIRAISVIRGSFVPSILNFPVSRLLGYLN